MVKTAVLSNSPRSRKKSSRLCIPKENRTQIFLIFLICRCLLANLTANLRHQENLRLIPLSLNQSLAHFHFPIAYLPCRLAGNGGGDEGVEQRVGFVGAAFEFGVELAAQHKGMVA